LLGYPTQAALMAQRTVDEARRLDHPVTHCIALIWAASVNMWVGDYARVEQDIDRFIAYAEAHSLTPYLAVGRGVKGELAIRRGDPERGVRAIERCQVELSEARYELLTTSFNLTLSEGLIATGRTEDALELIDRTMTRVQADGDLYNLPELLRIKARALLCTSQSRVGEAQTCLLQSLEWSRGQGARSWELRAASDLARLWAGDGRRYDARTLLQTVLAKFEEGFETRDLQQATLLLRKWDEAELSEPSLAHTA
jgi:predicted ATPase